MIRPEIEPWSPWLLASILTLGLFLLLMYFSYVDWKRIGFIFFSYLLKKTITFLDYHKRIYT